MPGAAITRSSKAGRQTPFSVLSGVTATALLGWTCFFAPACSGSAVRRAAIGEEIAVGPYAFSVRRARPAPYPPPPLNILRDEPGMKAVVVTVLWHTLPDHLDVGSRRSLIEGILRHQVSISDSAGRRSLPDGAIPESFVRWQDAPPNWDEWAVVFYVAEGSRDLVFVVENPEPRDGQARVTAVRLGI